MAARRLERLTQLKADLEAKYGVTVTVGVLDLTNPASGDDFFAALPEDLRDNVDILVNNAGVGIIPAPLWNVKWDQVDSVVDTNVKGVIKMIKLFVPGMLKRQSGHIINISSVLGKISGETFGVYAGSKFMLEAMTASLRGELVATPLRVSMVAPGLVDSEFASAIFPDNPEIAASFLVGMKALDPADVADSILFVASRPLHVQIADITTTPSAQAGLHFHKTT